MMKLPNPINTFISRRAIDRLAEFHRSIGEQPPSDSEMSNMLFVVFFNFLDAFGGAQFLTQFKRHSFTAASVGKPSMDNTNVLILHIENQGDRWMIGTPEEFPLDPAYEQQRAIDEAKLLLAESERP